MTITAKYPGNCRKCNGAVSPGETVTWQKGVGTAHVTCPAPSTDPAVALPAEHVPTGLRMPTPADDTRAGRMLLAGELLAAVTLPNGEHVTAHFRALLPPDVTADAQWARCAWDADDRVVLISAGKRGQRIGRMRGHLLTFHRDVTEPVQHAIMAVLAAASGTRPVVETLPSDDADAHGLRMGDFFIQAASYCGACGRELKRPESIDLGLGPECSGKGHRQYDRRGHATVRTTATAPAGDEEARMHAIEAQGDREQTVREETAKAEARRVVENFRDVRTAQELATDYGVDAATAASMHTARQAHGF